MGPDHTEGLEYWTKESGLECLGIVVHGGLGKALAWGVPCLRLILTAAGQGGSRWLQRLLTNFPFQLRADLRFVLM